MSDVAAKEEFLSAMQQKFGALTPGLNFLGLFNVFTSIGFYVVLAALVISILGCTTHRIPGLWQRWRKPRVAVSPAFFSKTKYRGQVTATGDARSIMDTAEARMKEARYRVIRGGDNILFADKNSWGPLGTVLAHLAFIIIIGAFILTSVGTYEQRLTLIAGAGIQEPVEKLGDVTIEAISFDAPYTWEPVTDQEGNQFEVPKYSDYISHLVLRNQGEVVAEKDDVRVNSPLHYRGYSFHQMDFGRTIDVTIVLDGEELYSGPLIQSVFTGNQKTMWWWPGNEQELGGEVFEAMLPLTEWGLAIFVIVPAFEEVTHPGLGSDEAVINFVAVDEMGRLSHDMGEYLVRLGETSDPIMKNLENRDPAKSIFEITVQGTGSYTSIALRRDPGAIWMLVGSLGLIVGMLMTFMFRHRRIWMRADEGTLYLASADKKDSGFTREFEDITKQARTWLTSSRNPS
jgi:cytochrome c biogenesis protein